MKNEMLPDMLTYTIDNFFPHIQGTPNEKIVLMFEEIVERTAHTVALWQCYGFCHGVLNTDNMSILGLTIDYGPFGFLEHFNPDHICNHSDNEGRYKYSAQPEICLFNLEILAQALEPLLPKDKSMPNLSKNFWKAYHETYDSLMARKFGLTVEKEHEHSPDEAALIKEFFKCMELTSNDMTNTFRQLASVNSTEESAFLNNILSHAASKEIKLNRTISKWAGNE
jgi:serine/tyrosine/threonine adenylyltransferase